MNDLSIDERAWLEHVRNGTFFFMNLVRFPRVTVRCENDLNNSAKRELFHLLMGTRRGLQQFSRRYGR